MKPLLSIGIIFKNEIRCLERCLKSLDGIRKAIPCELVMADTGSDDGSHEIAEKYADILIDFPWVNDFSAARNAVMDQCSGAWYLSIDADEWLDEDFTELVQFVRTNNENAGHFCGVIVRNYMSDKLDWQYSDFMAVRMVRMSLGLRYEGRIHEIWDPEGHYNVLNPLSKTILHHDGYVVLNNGSEEGKEKLRRNIALLDQELEDHPESIKVLLQRIESCGSGTAEQIPFLRRAIQLLRDHPDLRKEPCAPVIMSQGVHTAHGHCLPEIWEWVALADEWFPDTIYTTVDIQFYATEHAWVEMDCRKVVEYGERYLRGAKNYREGNYNILDLMQSPIYCAPFHYETGLRSYIARAYVYEQKPEKALEILGTMDYDTMDEDQADVLMTTLLRLHSLSQVDTAPLMREFWSRINAPKPSQEIARKRRNICTATAGDWFTANWVADETAMMEKHVVGTAQMQVTRAEEWNVVSKMELMRHGYTLFKPVLGESEMASAAMILDESDPEKMAGVMAAMEDVAALPIHALAYAVHAGVCFLMPDRLWKIEELDAVAARMSRTWGDLYKALEIVAAEDFAGDWQKLLWARALALAAMQACEWKDEAQGLSVVQAFVKVERDFLPGYYAPNILREENQYALPALHRFGWYCVKAFDNLEAGDAVSCVRYLREGLASCEQAKKVVEFLLDKMPGLQAPPPSPEMLELAEKIRTILSMYPADDPAVTSLKSSPAYQKVAHLIEN